MLRATAADPATADPGPIRRGQRGMVTFELAVGMLTACLMAGMLGWTVSLVALQARCSDAAGQIVRQLARGDQEAAQEAEQHVPDGARVQVVEAGQQITVQVAVDARIGRCILRYRDRCRGVGAGRGSRYRVHISTGAHRRWIVHPAHHRARTAPRTTGLRRSAQRREQGHRCTVTTRRQRSAGSRVRHRVHHYGDRGRRTGTAVHHPCGTAVGTGEDCRVAYRHGARRFVCRAGRTADGKPAGYRTGCGGRE